MVGANIDRGLSSNVPKEDEVAYMNRMKMHLRSHPELKSTIKLSSNYSHLGLSVHPDLSPPFSPKNSFQKAENQNPKSAKATF